MILINGTIAQVEKLSTCSMGDVYYIHSDLRVFVDPMGYILEVGRVYTDDNLWETSVNNYTMRNVYQIVTDNEVFSLN